MKERGIYLRKYNDEKVTMFVNVEQFKLYLDANSKGKEWVKFTIYKNQKEKFGYNIKLNENGHE